MPVCKKCKNYVLTIPCPHCGSGEEFHSRGATDIKQIVPSSVQAVTRKAPDPIPIKSSSTRDDTNVHLSLEKAYEELDPKGHSNYKSSYKKHTSSPRTKSTIKTTSIPKDHDFRQNYNDEKIVEFEQQIKDMNSSIKTLSSLVKTLIKNNEVIIKVISNDYNNIEDKQENKET